MGGPLIPAVRPGLDDAEGSRIPAGLPPVVDAHVHLFPDRLFEAIWRWFDTNAWPVRYRLTTPRVVEFLLARGVSRIVALHYAHKPGMARLLNRYVAEVCNAEPRVIGLATVLPGEEGAASILQEAFDLGLAGVKLHCHVQCFAPDAPALSGIYEACASRGKPLVMHAGREPNSPAYLCDPYALCSAERVERVLRAHPRLKLCIPHLGVDELDAYRRLADRFDNLWLDTTMMLAGYFPGFPPALDGFRTDRILYGTDFPNIPYAWDRELKALLALGLSESDLERVLGGNAMELYSRSSDR